MKLLVVEDDLTLSTVICFELDCNDYLTVAAYNCKKAYQLIQREHFDLAILDVNLPDGNGFDLCREVKAIKPELGSKKSFIRTADDERLERWFSFA